MAETNDTKKNDVPEAEPANRVFNNKTDHISPIQSKVGGKGARFQLVIGGAPEDVTDGDWIAWYKNRFGFKTRNALGKAVQTVIGHRPDYAKIQVAHLKTDPKATIADVQKVCQDVIDEYKVGQREATGGVKVQLAAEKARADTAEATVADYKAQLDAALAKLAKKK